MLGVDVPLVPGAPVVPVVLGVVRPDVPAPFLVVLVVEPVVEPAVVEWVVLRVRVLVRVDVVPRRVDVVPGAHGT